MKIYSNDPDVAAGTADGGTYACWVYLLDGTDGSIIWSRNMPGAVWTCIPIGDINEDSIPDIAVGLGNGQGFDDVIRYPASKLEFYKE